MKRVIAVLATVVAIIIGVQNIPGESDKIAFNITTSGLDRVLVIGVAYKPSGDRAVNSIICDGESLTRTGQVGSLANDIQFELWSLVNPSLGEVPVTITMSEDCEAVASVVNLANVKQDTPFDGEGISVGQSVPAASVTAPGGDATLLMVFNTPKAAALSTPSGFSSMGSEAGEENLFRASCFVDDDASQPSASLSFSEAVDFGAFILGVYLAS